MARKWDEGGQNEMRVGEEGSDKERWILIKKKKKKRFDVWKKWMNYGWEQDREWRNNSASSINMIVWSMKWIKDILTAKKKKRPILFNVMALTNNLGGLELWINRD